MTWAADGAQVTSMCDGDWLGTARQGYFHNRLYRIGGGPAGFSREELAGYPAFDNGDGGWFGYGVVSVDGVLYSAVSKTPDLRWSGPFRGVKLLRSDDRGRTWSRVGQDGCLRPLPAGDRASHAVTPDEMFFGEAFAMPHEQQVAYPFSYFDWVQCGQDNAAAQDDYLYMYAPEGAQAHRLMLGRVHKTRVGVRDDWEFFAGREHGRSRWSGDLGDRCPVHLFPEHSGDGCRFGWYSWLPSVVWNPGLGLYIMVNGGTYAGRGMTGTDTDYYDDWMHTRTGSLGFWYAARPDGPWYRFFYTDDWIVDHPGNRTYQPKLSPKWIGASGREMVLVWSDAMSDSAGQSHTVHYTWNQMAVTIELGQAPPHGENA